MDRRIFVVGFGLYGSIHGPAEYDVNLQVIHTSSGKVCGSNNTSFSCDGSNYTFRVMFKEPVEIHPNTSYTASATLKVRLFVHARHVICRNVNIYREQPCHKAYDP